MAVGDAPPFPIQTAVFQLHRQQQYAQRTSIDFGLGASSG